jgi:hypothetical protein
MMKDSALRALIGDYGKTTKIPTTNLPGASIGGTTDSTTEKYGDVFSGNWSEFLFGRWGGIEIEDDKGIGTGFTTDETYVKMRMYAGTANRRESAFTLCPDAKMR